MRNYTSILLCLCCVFISFAQSDPDFSGETVTFKASDGIRVTADLYMAHESSAPFIILYHQAGYSRGEYRSIAPKLNVMGFNCLAVDQRSGDKVNGVINETHKVAVADKLPTEYLDAIPDIEAAYLYVKYSIKPDKIILWGSSYSASILFFMGSEHHNNLSGILCFAPGNYFKINNKELKTFAAKITCPLFVTSAKSEYKNWKGMYDQVKSEKSYFLPETEGKHGSKALWNDNPSHQAYWTAVTKFLKSI
jgi:dienelactone hydrolase